MPDIRLDEYRVCDPGDPFEDHVGPFHYRKGPEGMHFVCPTAGHQLNSGGMIHGGLLLTFADYALCMLAGDAAGDKPAITVSLNASFIDAGHARAPLEITGDVPRVGKSLAFSRGVITQEGRPLLAFSGVTKPIARTNFFGRAGSGPETAAAPASPLPPSPPVPPGYVRVERDSPFLAHTGDHFALREDGRTRILQPTLPQHRNSGGNLHGGALMSFADNALSTVVAEATGKAPLTTSFAAEFLAGGILGPALESEVELVRATRNFAFVRGLVTQDSRPLLTFTAVVRLVDRAAIKPATG